MHKSNYRWIRGAAEHPVEAGEEAPHAWSAGSCGRARSKARQRSIRKLIASDSHGLFKSVSQRIFGARQIHSRYENDKFQFNKKKSSIKRVGGGGLSSPEPINYKSLFKHIFCAILCFLRASCRAKWIFYARLCCYMLNTTNREKMLLVGKKYKLFGGGSAVLIRLINPSNNCGNHFGSTATFSRDEFFMAQRLIIHISFGSGAVRKY